MSALTFAPVDELERLVRLDTDVERRVRLVADACRLNTLYMIARAGSGHIGSSFSSLDIVTWLYLEHLRPGDRYFSSKGHDAPGLYSVLVALRRLPEDALHTLRRLRGLPGHPDVATPGMPFNTGPLGMGISKAQGLIAAERLAGNRDARVVVMTGDGELQEGQIWESLRPAAIARMRELTVVVDNNRLQSDTFVSAVSDLGALEDRFAAHGWTVRRCDGHSASALVEAFAAERDGPLVVVADTIKGRGVSFMEHTAMTPDDELYHYHSGAPSADDYAAGVAELRTRIDETLASIGERELKVVEVERPSAAGVADDAQRLVPAYGRALIEAAKREPRIVALDADLVLDTGLIPFRDAFPDRFIECGIAEQHMVSMASGLAAGGLLPIVNSFACFLSTRPNEQIYNNATERRPIVYVGSLAGLLPAGPGHSHQAVRDLASLGAMPGLTVVQPATEREVAHAVEWAVGCGHSVYLRLTSIPVSVPFEVPDEPLIAGTGRIVRPGDSGLVVLSYGPVMLTEVWRAAELLAADGVHATIVDHPFPTAIDAEYLRALVSDARLVVTVDDHYTDGGLGSSVAAALAAQPGSPALARYGVDRIPECGTADEVLSAHGLDHASLASAWEDALAAVD